MFPQFMDDEDPEERELAIFMDIVLMGKCSEVWVFGSELSEGMRLEIDRAKKRKQPVRYFNDQYREVKLEYDLRTMTLKNTLRNARLIIENDQQLKGIVFNQLADGLEIKGDVSWKHPAKFWRDADDAQLICYVDDHYGTFAQRNYDVAITKVADDRSYHPIRQYFESLPPWDGELRVDTLFIDYLGADDNEYIRAVCRKTLCAAYMRVYHPGIKFDYLPVFNGAQGIGKSTFISNLGMEWFSDSLTLSDMNDKTAAEKLQGYWIHEIGELAGMKKADLDKVKAFVSRCDDKYRASFGRRVTPHPRQCIFFGTTNSENGYLRDITGNRRFWNVKVTGESKYKPWEMTQEIIDQIWAEVILLAKAGEKLYLPPDLESYAQEEQREAMEQDDREGLVREYLDMSLPITWSDMDVYRRRDYFREPNDPTRPEGTIRRTEVSNLEIWCECLRVEIEALQDMDFDPMLTGFDEAELADLFGTNDTEVEDDDFDLSAALEKAAFVERGDIWTVGRHRLMCGDATSKEDVDRLMDGKTAKIKRGLEADGILNGAGHKKWHESNIKQILTNEKYIGDALLQKTYTKSILDKKRCRNDGQLPKYYVEGSHEAIIDKDVFLRVQAEMVRRANLIGRGKKRIYNYIIFYRIFNNPLAKSHFFGYTYFHRKPPILFTCCKTGCNRVVGKALVELQAPTYLYIKTASGKRCGRLKREQISS